MWMLRSSMRTTASSPRRAARILPGSRGSWFKGGMRGSVPLVSVRRGGHAESLHVGAVALWRDGRLVATLGDPARVTFYRSASKPLQALVGVHLGTADAFGLTDAELALATGSHSGAEPHVAAARSILAKARVPEQALGCG